MPDRRSRPPLLGRSAPAALVAMLLIVAALPAAADARLRAPHQISPSDGAHVQAVPAFSWSRARHAAKYEFQLAADRRFKSVVFRGSYFAANTFATVLDTLADGRYYWRVRGLDARARAGRWSGVRSISKAWTARPIALSPAAGGDVPYPATPLVLRWSTVPYAYKYRVQIAKDPALAQTALDLRKPSIETSATALALQQTLQPDNTYYWAVTPLDADKHPGTRSAVSSFVWRWPSAMHGLTVADANAEPAVYDPSFSWQPLPGAVSYEVEINPSHDWAVGSKVCCTTATEATTFSPTKLLPNNTYFWRVRGVDADGNAGDWNEGPAFTKTFDGLPAAVPCLNVRDAEAPFTAGARCAPASTPPVTDAPVVDWDPVAGASSYEVGLAPWEGFCNWTARTVSMPTSRSFLTATTAWTALGPQTPRTPIGHAFPTVANDGGWHLWPDTSYCVRVRARSDRDASNKDIVSTWTELGGSGPDFTVPVTQPSCQAAQMRGDAYHAPELGAGSDEMPLFTWDRIAGACGYFIVVARDPQFTKIVDVALTNEPAYAPRTAAQPTTYADESSPSDYYWAVMPTRDANGDGLSTDVLDDFPQQFQKLSDAPSLISPSPFGTPDVPTHPVFQWRSVLGAREYRIQVDDNQTFNHPIVDALTSSTVYASTGGLPAGSVLFWRVRANDENRLGLPWSVGRFRRTLPVPSLGQNPTAGEGIPVLSWAPVPGASSYDMHVEQADGTKRDFRLRSSAFTAGGFYGTGVWHWQVRANFGTGLRVAPGGYSAPSPFARRIATPTGVRTRKANGGVLFSWAPALMAHQYRVQISDTDSFSHVLEQATTDNAGYAPHFTSGLFARAHRLYWRVAVLDEGRNVGGWVTRPLRSLTAARIAVKGSPRTDRKGTVHVRVTDAGGRPIRGAIVRVSGAGLTGHRRTDAHGRATFRLKARAKGRVRVSAEKRGYAPAQTTIPVR